MSLETHSSEGTPAWASTARELVMATVRVVVMTVGRGVRAGTEDTTTREDPDAEVEDDSTAPGP